MSTSKNKLIFEPQNDSIIESVQLASGAEADEIPSEEELNGLAEAVALLDTLTKDGERLSNLMKINAQSIEHLAINVIPQLLANAPNLQFVKFKDGRKLSLKDELFCRITDATEEQAYRWLEQNQLDSIIKNNLTFNLGKGKEANEKARKLTILAEQLGVVEFAHKRAVHNGTLSATLREQLDKGKEVPKEAFNVFQQRRAVVK